jgi:hypothetical protein
MSDTDIGQKIGSNQDVQRTTAGAMAQGQTAQVMVGKIATQTGAPTTTALFTVPAGQTLYVTDIIITSDAASGAATTIDVRIQSAAVDIFRQGMHNLAPVDACGIETQPQAAAGAAVTLVLPQTTSIQNVWYYIAGYVQ